MNRAASAGVVLVGSESASTDDRVRQLADDDLLGQLLDRRGRMRELGDEGGDIKLDWADAVELALGHPAWLAALAAEAQAILDAGIRHVVWSGMGGSVQTVYCLKRMGFLDLPDLTIHPLDSTDPASLNRVIQEIGATEGLDPGALGGDASSRRSSMQQILGVTMMTGVSMGMTSEEPITHLTWFDGLLQEYAIAQPELHLQVMTLPDSYLDRFARQRGARMVPIQLDGESHTPGRMSAPATRVFLRPVALALTAAGSTDVTGDLRTLLQQCQTRYGLTHTESAAERRSRVETDPFIRLGAYMADEAIRRGRNKMVLLLPPEWQGLGPWVEQLVEESLGKDGKGWLIFYDQDAAALREREDCVFLVHQPEGEAETQASTVAMLRQAGRPVLTLRVALDNTGGLPPRLAALAGLFASWKLAVTAFGYLNDIVIVGQPGVEGYKTYARELRDGPGVITFGPKDADPALQAITATIGEGVVGEIAGAPKSAPPATSDDVKRTVAVLQKARQEGWLRYLDVTYNGEVTPELMQSLEVARQQVGTRALRMATKLRTGPSDYHSTEQSETDGPPELVSIRIIALRHVAPIVGTYTDRFLLAQARGTWQAMRDAGRWVVLVTLPNSEAAAALLRSYFSEVAERLTA